MAGEPGAGQEAPFDRAIINQALHHTRAAVTAEIAELIEEKRATPGAYAPLYDLLQDYPFRTGKMLRPALCIAVARAVGGMGQQALTAAAALELYHNAFLIHDDVEDGSESRRGKGTLHALVGVPRAINVGDATNVLAVSLLLENLAVVGVAKALAVLHEIELMARQSAEGQAIELDWVASNASNLGDQDYFTMCVKKTCWYSFMTPCRIGLIAGTPAFHEGELEDRLAALTRFGMALGIAFQIQDDLLNLEGEMAAYGKEIGGDVFEGKRTLMLNHVLAHAGPDAPRILATLAKPRAAKTAGEVAFIMDRMVASGSLEHSRRLAREHAARAVALLEAMDFLQPESPILPGERWSAPAVDRRFLRELVDYVVYRNV